LLIPSSFPLRCLASGDYPDHFSTIVFFMPRVGYKEHHDPACQTDGLPSLLGSLVPILDRQMIRVVENQASGIETDTVLHPVALILALIPLTPYWVIVVINM